MSNEKHIDALIDVMIEKRAEHLARLEYERLCYEMREDWRAGRLSDPRDWEPSSWKKKIRYRYPEGQIYMGRPDIYNRVSPFLNCGELTDKNFKSPIKSLLDSLEKDGNVIAACRIEHNSLFKIVKKIEVSTCKLLNDVLDIRGGMSHRYDEKGR